MKNGGEGRIDRRSFLAALAVGGGYLAGCTERGSGTDAASSSAGAPGTDARTGEADGALTAWGVQLYTLRDRLDDDLDRTLAAVAEIGYGEVELFQLHGLTPGAMRGKLDAVGLRASSSHYPIEAFRVALDRTVEGAAELGQALMVVPSIPPEERTPEGLVRIADDLNRAGERARQEGLRVGYHNHDWEMRAMPDGTRPIDLLLDRTDPRLVDWQMDIFWTVHGGGDPLATLAERDGRVTSVHVKDRTAEGEMVDVGAGVIDFGTLLTEAGRRGLLHAFVEHDRPTDSVESIRQSHRHLASLNLTSPRGRE